MPTFKVYTSHELFAPCVTPRLFPVLRYFIKKRIWVELENTCSFFLYPLFMSWCLVVSTMWDEFKWTGCPITLHDYISCPFAFVLFLCLKPSIIITSYCLLFNTKKWSTQSLPKQEQASKARRCPNFIKTIINQLTICSIECPIFNIYIAAIVTAHAMSCAVKTSYFFIVIVAVKLIVIAYSYRQTYSKF